MVLNEAPSERIQKTWYARLAQERRELSASVEDALVNTPFEESFWQDGQSQLAPVAGTGQNDKVVLPRLSLQSRSLPGSSSRVGTGLVNTQSDTAQHTSIWTRFTQRLTSLFAPLRFHSTPALPPVADGGVAMSSAQVKEVICPSNRTSDPSDSRVLSATTQEVSSKAESQVETDANGRYGASRSPRQERQRLAGRTTRIRLEAVPAPSSASIANKEKHYQELERISSLPCEDALSHMRVPAVPAFRAHNHVTSASLTVPNFAAFANKGVTSVHLPTVEKGSGRLVEDHPFVDNDGGTTSIRLSAFEKVARRPVEGRTFTDGDCGTTSIRIPTVEKVVRKQEVPSLVWHAGAGRFECGQRDATISDPSVTASSVVLVTLTANPGPVVVQYVSLQPGTGFTVHLTAPTAVGAPFNYVVLF